MEKNQKFTIKILAAIAIYLVIITTTANATKSIGFKNSSQSEVQSVDTTKAKNITPAEEVKNTTSAAEIENNAKINNDISVQTLQSEEDTKTNLEEKQNIDPEILNNDTRYITKPKAYVYPNPNSNKKIDILLKATKVNVLKEENIETKKETRNKKSNGTFETKITSVINKWAQIEYTKNLKTKTAWIKSSYLTDNYHHVLPKNLKNADFSAVIKKEYPNNPKREDIRGIYVTMYSISSKKKLKSLIDLTKKTDINAFVIDVKEDEGLLLFETEAEKKYLGVNKKNYPIKDINLLMKELKENNIYTIARIVSFKDPRYAKINPDKAIIKKADGKPFTNSDGVIWVSAHDRNLWEYNVAVAKEAAKVGFNEIQFDYVRFPASNGGKLDSQLDYRNTNNESKPETIQNYLKYARKELEPYNIYIAADVYGQVGSSYDDMALGQHWETVSNVTDIICPMAYPSHYGKGVYGLSVPDAFPYQTIYRSTLDGINRNNNIDTPASVRPWLQAFTAKWVKGHIPYGKKEIEEQVKALRDLGINQYLLWSPTNKYSLNEK